MAESKLVTYQLAGGVPIFKPQIGFELPKGEFSPAVIGSQVPVVPKQNWWQRNNINTNSVMNFMGNLLNLAGGTANVIAAFKKGEPMQVGNQTLDPAQAQMLYQVALANQQAGGGQAGNEAMLRMMEQNQQMIFQMMNNKNTAENKDNTLLYVGGAVLAVVVIGGIIYVATKK
ncbi:hypothetical protein [Capnocytophaga canimorsus]|uniref:hypothetical protein n=1 Tax=Capnocytophaga canimorsus TaxID=28188 RepID=UPI0037D3F31F